MSPFKKETGPVEMESASVRHPRAGRSGARGGAMIAGWRCRAGAVLLVAAAVCAPATIDAQWVKHRTPGIPRVADGTSNLSAPAPKTPDGRPDFSGMWITAPANALPCGRGLVECGIELPMSREGAYMGATIPAGLPYQAWAAEIVKKNMATSSKDDPHGICLPDTFLRAYGLPHIVKFVQTRQLLILSLAKFVMVVGFFMHLKYDNRLYRFMFAAGLVVTLGVYLAVLAMAWTGNLMVPPLPVPELPAA